MRPFLFSVINRSVRIARFDALSALTLLTLSLPFSLQAESVLLRNVSIISGDKPQPSAAQHVLLRDGKIQAIGAELLPADRQIDATGKYLLPGPIDSHVHFDCCPI